MAAARSVHIRIMHANFTLDLYIHITFNYNNYSCPYLRVKFLQMGLFGKLHLQLYFSTLNVIACLLAGKQPPFNVVLKIRDLTLPIVNSCHDLSILVCGSLRHSSYIANVISAANQRRNLILRTFTSKSAFVTYVRPLLEYNSVVWSPQYVSDIRAPEQIQRRFTKRLPSLRHFRYSLRIEQLGLQPLELRRLHDW